MFQMTIYMQESTGKQNKELFTNKYAITKCDTEQIKHIK